MISRQPNSDAGMRSPSRNHSRLITKVLNKFAASFAPGATLLYVNDSQIVGRRNVLKALFSLGIRIDDWNAMPDVVLRDEAKHRLFLVDSVFGHGSIGTERRSELETLFATVKECRVYVTAFPNRQLMARYLPDIAWETEVWVADSPSHLIHFNGDRFMGPRSR